MATITKNQMRKIKAELEFFASEGENLYAPNFDLSVNTDTRLDLLYTIRPFFIGCMGHLMGWIAETPLSEIMDAFGAK